MLAGMSTSFQPTPVPGLPSPYDEVGGLVYFARMVAKIRLRAEGKLPEAYYPNLGEGFDARCVCFLNIGYNALKAEVLRGGRSDEELLEWCFYNGRRPSPEEIEVWNGFLMKRGWRDATGGILAKRLREAGLPEDGSIPTMFDFIDVDEGRPLRSFSW